MHTFIGDYLLGGRACPVVARRLLWPLCGALAWCLFLTAPIHAQSASLFLDPGSRSAVPTATHVGISLGRSAGPDEVFVGVHSDKVFVDAPGGRNVLGGIVFRLDGEYGAAAGVRRISAGAGVLWDSAAEQRRHTIYVGAGVTVNFDDVTTLEPPSGCCMNGGMKVLVGARTARGRFVEVEGEAGRGAGLRVSAGYRFR